MVKFKTKTPLKTYKGYKLQGTVKKGRPLEQRKKYLKEKGIKMKSKSYSKDKTSIYIL